MMTRSGAALFAASLLLAGCSDLSLKSALGTPKNPTAVFQNPAPDKGKKADQLALIEPLYNTLLEAHRASPELARRQPDQPKPDQPKPGEPNAGGSAAEQGKAPATDPSPPPLVLGVRPSGESMRRYLGAGFALSDIYCAHFFAKTDEAYRRRRFGRTLTNDVGTAITTLLGLASAGEKIVTGMQAGFGLADGSWRNYDDSFIVSPDLSNVQSLVFAAQDNFRARVLRDDDKLPSDYGSAQTVILRYANLCSFLGMKSLLDQSASDERSELNKKTEEIVTRDPKSAAKKPGSGTGTDAKSPAGQSPSATPSAAPGLIAPNKLTDPKNADPADETKPDEGSTP